MWDSSSGKCVETLKGHEHEKFCYKAAFDSESLYVASVGSDKATNFWDLRNTKSPVFKNLETKNILMSCDFSYDN